MDVKWASKVSLILWSQDTKFSKLRIIQEPYCQNKLHTQLSRHMHINGPVKLPEYLLRDNKRGGWQLPDKSHGWCYCETGSQMHQVLRKSKSVKRQLK